jgi:hypothetical protein
VCHLQALNYLNASVNFELRNTYLRRIIGSTAVSFVHFCKREICHFHYAASGYHDNELWRGNMLHECESFLCNISVQAYWKHLDTGV